MSERMLPLCAVIPVLMSVMEGLAPASFPFSMSWLSDQILYGWANGVRRNSATSARTSEAAHCLVMYSFWYFCFRETIIMRYNQAPRWK